MDQERLKRYYELFIELADRMNRTDSYDREVLHGILRQFAELFHLTKGVTEFYIDQNHEQNGEGESLVGFDMGPADKVVIRNRILTRVGSIVIGTVYAAAEADPLTEEEWEKADVVLRTVCGFVARTRLQQAVEKFGFYDQDGYPNLKHFLRYVWRLAQKNELYGQAAVCFNLKHFSLINQQISRDAGDLVLRNFYEQVNGIIMGRGILCRIGGDNFVAIFQANLLDEVLEMLAGVPVYADEKGEKRVMISARVGVFVVPQDYKIVNPGQIMEMVYPAAQMAKQRGVSPVFYDKEIFEAREYTMKIRNQFQEGMAKHEFQAYYQPKVDIITGEIVGAAALCRWFREGRMVMPMEFIPVLEQNMDICVLDYHILSLVCRDIRRWLDEGKKVVRVSVNLSRKHLVDADLLENVISTIDTYHVPHEYIEIELTETTTDVEFNALKRVVTGLQSAGIYTSVDDFGNGFSSLNLIRAIPWNVLKIDRSLLPMDDEKEESITHRMYKHIVAMAQDIGIDCVTEGVETLKQVDVLRRNGCPVAQGFYFDKALPMEKFEEKLNGEPYQIPE